MLPFDVMVAGLLPTGGGEWVLIFLIVLLLFGGAKLPSLAKGLGQSIKEFKKAQKDDEPAKDAPQVPAVVPPEAKKPDPASTHGSN
jgi:sec-independent protein translocase protein TatA